MTTEPRPIFHAAPFLTTRWTRVCLAKADSEDGRTALADLCEAYYEPVVAYLRSVLRDGDAAREMSHAFFAEMLGGGTIHMAERERGRFRFYLLGAVKHFLAHRWETARRMKRAGGVEAVSLDDAEAAEVPDARLPRRLQELREGLGLSMYALWMKCGASRDTISRVVTTLLIADAV